MKHISLLAVCLLAHAACAVDDGSAPTTADSDLGKADGVSASAGSDCVVDTIHFKRGFELVEDLRATMDPSLIDSAPGVYDNLRIPSTFRASLPPATAAYGRWIYSFHGWDLVPTDLVHSMVGDAPEGAIHATIEGGPAFSPDRVFDAKRHDTARDLFDAMTQANETVTEHIVPPAHVYDRSWIRIRRSGPNGRIVCDHTVFPDEVDPRPVYACVMTDVAWKSVQAYDPAQSDGFCPSR